MLGAINNAWFRYLEDIGPAGPDKGEGGKYLVIPPNYDGNIPDGYFVVQSDSYRHWVFMRASIAEGLEAAVENVKKNLRVYPLSLADNPPEMEWVSGSGQAFNTVHPNNFEFYEHVNEIIQYEPYGLLDAETRGPLRINRNRERQTIPS